MFLALTHKPTEFVVQVFAQAFTVCVKLLGITRDAVHWQTGQYDVLLKVILKYTVALLCVIYLIEIEELQWKVCPDGGTRKDQQLSKIEKVHALNEKCAEHLFAPPPQGK